MGLLCTSLLSWMPWLYAIVSYLLRLLHFLPVVPLFPWTGVLSCLKGGISSLCHNDVRDLTTSLLTEVCFQVIVEPELQPVSNPD